MPVGTALAAEFLRNFRVEEGNESSFPMIVQHGNMPVYVGLEAVPERRKVLERILKPASGVQLGSYVDAEGTALFELTKEKGMEGIIAKRKDSLYRPGKRRDVVTEDFGSCGSKV